MLIKTDNQNDSLFLNVWLLASLYHDIGYLVENKRIDEDDEKTKNTRKQVIDAINEMIINPLASITQFYSNRRRISKAKENQNVIDKKIETQPIQSLDAIESEDYFSHLQRASELSYLGMDSCNGVRAYYDFAKSHAEKHRGAPFRDHGISSALILLCSWLSYNDYICQLCKDGDYLIRFRACGEMITDLHNNLENFLPVVETAAQAISLHNINKSIWADCDTVQKKIDLESFYVCLNDDETAMPIAFLLRLCDELQVWDRPRFRTPSTKDENIYSSAISIFVSDEGIFLRFFKDEDDFLHPDIYHASHYSKLKRVLEDYLDSDDISRLLKYGKPGTNLPAFPVLRNPTSPNTKDAVAKTLIHISELEKIEREYCDKGNAKIIVVTNDLTCDYAKFRDEIIRNINSGVEYYYLIPASMERKVKNLQRAVLSADNNHPVGYGRFDYKVDTLLFKLCPPKYTVVLYDRGPYSVYDNDALMVFCCAQDKATKTNLYYFRYSDEHAQQYKECLFDILKLEESKMVEYYPWSKAVLNMCISESKAGKIPALDLELTAKCSGAECIYCDSKPDVCLSGMSNELDYENLKVATLAAKQRGLKWVYTCGLGEPLEDPKFWDYIQLLKENQIQLSMFSNGIFIRDLSTAKKLKECGVNIILKMDTFEEEKFDRILGRRGAAKKIYAARDYLLEAGYGTNSSGLTDLAFSIVPTSLSIDGIPAVISFCKEHGIFASIGELEQAGEVVRKGLSPVLGLAEKEVRDLKKIADDYYGGPYMRPICPCIMTGVHIDNLGNCIVDRESGLNCKWFLLKNPSVEVIGNIKESSVEELYKNAQEYRATAFEMRKKEIHNSCNVSYVFGGCGGNPTDIIKLVERELMH